MIGACLEAARSRDDPADVANCAIEELVRQRCELPVLNTLLRAARKARELSTAAIRLAYMIPLMRQPKAACKHS